MSLNVHPTEIVEKSSSPLLRIHPSWERIPLGEIAAIQNGAAFKSGYFNKQGQGMPLLRIRDVGSDDTQAHYDGPYEERFLVEPGDLIVGMDGDFRVARWQGAQSLLNQRVCRIDVQDPAVYDSRFLRHVLPGYLDAVHEFTSSVTVKHLSSKTVAQIPVPLPPVPEQRRIVEAIETHLSRIDAGVKNLQRAQRNIERMQASILKAAVEGRLVPQDPNDEPVDAYVLELEESRGERSQVGKPPWTLPASWAWATIGSLFDVYVGTTPSRKDAALWAGDVPWVSSGEVAFNRIGETRETIAMAAISNPTTRLHPPGTVMIGMIGEGRTRGQAAILDITAAHNQNCASIRVSETQILPEWVYDYLASRYEASRRVASGGNQPALSKTRVRAMPIPIPPLKEQVRIVDEVDRQLSILDALLDAVAIAKTRADAARRSLLNHAFGGRLVPQDPADEPAAALLDRIRAEREGAAV